MNFMKFIAQEMREIMASLGFTTVDEMMGKEEAEKIIEEAIQNYKKNFVNK